MNPTTPFFILVFSVLIRTAFCHLNPHFQACEPKSCGNGPNITYPFYIQGKQDSFCGFPLFNLFCAPNGFPVFNRSNTFYIVNQIFYHNNSLRLSNPTFSISNSANCLSSSGNLTLGYRFTFAPNQEEVLLFFNCDLASLPEEMKENVLGCSEGNRTRSVLGMAEDDEEKKLKYAKANCQGWPMTTMVEKVEGEIREALGRGFLVKPRNWTATECDACERSGGRCGFLNTYAFGFRCLCRDGDHLLTCRSGLSLSLSVSAFLHYNFFVFNAHCGISLMRRLSLYNMILLGRF